MVWWPTHQLRPCYCYQGYGLRFLPSYADSLPHACACERPDQGHELPFMESVVQTERTWIAKILRTQERRDALFNQFLAARSNSFLQTKHTVPLIGHFSSHPSDIRDESRQRNDERGHSGSRYCLTGFTLFMRHVVLWESELIGAIK